MFYDFLNNYFCDQCTSKSSTKYSNLRRSQIRMKPENFKSFTDDLRIKSLEESSISIVEPPPNVQSEETCLFMINFDKTGKTMLTSSLNIIDIWDTKTNSKIGSLNEHTEIVTGVEWLKSPKDDMFISSSLDKTMKIWKEYTPIKTLNHHSDWLRCMSISSDNKLLISGCVSSLIYGYDLEKQKESFKISCDNSKNDNLNTINTLNFKNETSIFLAGTRDGYVRIFDIRTSTSKHINEFFAHKNKLNSAYFGNIKENWILTSGRDSAIRLWDLRKIESGYKNEINNHLKEFKGHLSQGYNIAANFFFNEKYIITGSEDSYIYIYDIEKGCLARKIQTDTKIIHLLKPYPSPKQGFAFSGLQRSTIHFFDTMSTEDERPPKETKKRVKQMGFDLNETSVKFIEEFMAENGDLILKVFHANNVSYSAGMSWENLMRVISAENDENSKLLLRKLNQVLLKNMQSFLSNPQTFQESRNEEKKEEELKNIEKTRRFKIENCQKCHSKWIIRQELKLQLEKILFKKN